MSDPRAPAGPSRSFGDDSGAMDTAMVTSLVRLHQALLDIALPLDLPGIDVHRTALAEMVDQLEDYVIPG